jgi:hypothetical protein
MTPKYLKNCSDETFVDGRCGQWVERIMRKIDNEFERGQRRKKIGVT